jgi:hypothetical protein
MVGMGVVCVLMFTHIHSCPVHFDPEDEGRNVGNTHLIHTVQRPRKRMNIKIEVKSARPFRYICSCMGRVGNQNVFTISTYCVTVIPIVVVVWSKAQTSFTFSNAGVMG